MNGCSVIEMNVLGVSRLALMIEITNAVKMITRPTVPPSHGALTTDNRSAPPLTMLVPHSVSPATHAGGNPIGKYVREMARAHSGTYAFPMSKTCCRLGRQRDMILRCM
jgi:hypothetical protein